MNAISLYVSASRLLFQSDSENPNYSDLYRLVPYLRQSLSCTVCANLLIEPYSPQDVCQHHVCRTCIGGRKNLKPTCSSCRNYQNYQPNTQLRILLQCYKSLCKYILGTPAVYSSMHKYVHVDAAVSNGSNEPHNLAELIDEGARFHDDYKSNSGLPKSAFSILPCIFTTTSGSTNQTQSNSSSSNVSMTTNKTTVQTTTTSTVLTPFTHSVVSHSTSAASTMPAKEKITVVSNPTVMIQNPPIKTVSNGTALYSVLYTGSGNKITIKRKTDDSVFTGSNTMSTKEMLNILSGNQATLQQANQQSLVKQPQQIHQQTQQIIHTQQHQGSVNQPQGFKKPIFAVKAVKTIQKRKGCRCGNATPTPGKLTCCGQRCPCYVESKSCVDCKCRGCRNPHRIDGLKVRPQIPQLTCLVQMNNQTSETNYLDMPIETFSNSSSSSTTPMLTKIKQEPMPIPTTISGNSHQIYQQSLNQQLDLNSTNDTIEYIPNELDDSNIQVVNVYTTHLPEISSTLPTIIMQDEGSMNTSAPSSGLTLHNHLSLQPESSFSLISEDLIKHSFSDDGCSSSGDHSDVEIDL